MSKKAGLWIAVLVILIGVGFVAFNKKGDTDDVAGSIDQEKNEAAQPEPSGKKMAFKDFLVNDRGSYQCTVHESMTDVENTGTVYIADGKVRGEFETVAEGKPVKTSLLVKDGYQYVWSSSMKTGIKINTDATTQSKAQSDGVYSWDSARIGDYDCKAWTTDPTTFDLPAGMTFTDFSAMMKTSTQKP